MPRRPSLAQYRLSAARLCGAAALGILGQFTVDQPDGYFGATDTITRFGAIYAVVVLVLAGAAAATCLRRGRFAMLLSSIVYATNVGAFLPAFVADPVVPGLVTLWNLLLLEQTLFPYRVRTARRPGDDEINRWLTDVGPAARHLLMVGLLITTVVIGYRVGDRIPALVVCVAVDVLVLATLVPFVRRLFDAGHPAWRVAVGGLLVSVVLSPWPEVALGTIGVVQGTLLAVMAGRSPLYHEVLHHFYRRPAMLLLATFIGLTAIGGLFLSFPASSSSGRAVAPLDAIFTATSASCVTGLVVRDTGHDFSLFGQVVILVLIQVGGLNIMVLSTFAGLMLGRGLGLMGERALGTMLDQQPEQSAYPLISFIVAFTAIVEGLGALALFPAFLADGDGLGAAAWQALFTSVSAFCNAGFALHADSLVRYATSPYVLSVIAILITVGGIGFAVLAAVWAYLRQGRPRRLSVQVRVVLLMSLALVTFGALFYAVAEWNRTLAGLSFLDKCVNALFQSITLRTAGFNSVDYGALHPGTVLMMLAFMFVGASPGGTGGGIKTTTLAVLLSAIPALAVGRARVVMLGRTIALETVYRSAAIAVVALLLAFAGGLALLASQPLPLDRAMFEVVSAIGTVGLSIGATAQLDGFGKGVIIVLMLLGRVGSLSAALLLTRERPVAIQRPEARLMVG